VSAPTPGPWRAIGGKGCHVIEAANGTSVAESFGRLDPENIANARLIAAAPDLLTSLRELVDSPNAKQNAAWDRARLAIAKTEGK